MIENLFGKKESPFPAGRRDRRDTIGLGTRLALVILAIAAVLAAPAAALAAEKVAAFLDGSSSTLGKSASTALALLKADLEKNQLTVVPVPALGEAFTDGDAARSALEAAGVKRLFVLNVMPLGEKLVVSLTERTAPSLAVAFSERMTASRVEELDVVIPRLVSAVLSRTAAGEEATVETVTDQEGRAWRKKYGEFLWGVGIPLGVALWDGGEFSYGLAGKVAYEMEAARIDLSATTQFNGSDEDLVYFNLAIEAYYLMTGKNISPYVGGGLGFAFTSIGDENNDLDTSAEGVIFNAGGGIEFFRLYKTRLMFDVKVGLPTYKLKDEWVPVLSGTLSFLW